MSGGYVDIWIVDLGTDWVIWEAWTDFGNGGPTCWQVSYAIDSDGGITFGDTPVAVAAVTSYQPVQVNSAEDAEAETADNGWLELELEAMRMSRPQRRPKA